MASKLKMQSEEIQIDNRANTQIKYKYIYVPIGVRHLGLKMQVSFDTSWFPLNLGLLDIGTKECHCQGFGLPPSCSFCDKSVTDQIGLTTWRRGITKITGPSVR